MTIGMSLNRQVGIASNMGREFALDFLRQLGGQAGYNAPMGGNAGQQTRQPGAGGSGLGGTPLNTPGGGMNPAMGGLHSGGMEQMHGDQAGQYGMGMGFHGVVAQIKCEVERDPDETGGMKSSRNTRRNTASETGRPTSEP